MAERIAKITQPLGEDYVLIGKQDVAVKEGVLFIEARIRDELREDLENQLSTPGNTFEPLEDILADERTAEMRLKLFYHYSKEALQSLRVVEYLGPETLETCYNSNNVKVKVQVYALFHTPRSLEEQKDFPEAETTQMPHAAFEGNWDELMFEDDIKGDLIWMMTNMLRYSQRFGSKGGEMNPLILLYGPPGTGKTSLCQGLAQKISIRLNSTYKKTELVQIKTAALMSKYYSESAKQVDRIFTKIARMCEENTERFICVLIDEVESIAGSREAVMKRSESQDSLRATNSLLTGLDRTRTYPNVIFLCTSNMLESLDSAFLDRCGLKRSVDPPSIASQYEILRSRTQKLITQGVIHSLEVLPPYGDADYQSEAGGDHAGCRLLLLVKLIRSGNAHAQAGAEISGRSLTQLPEQAIMRYLREEECDLDRALTFFKQFILSEQSQGKRYEEKDSDVEDENSEGFEGVELRGRKRKLKIILEEDSTIEKLEEVLAELRQRDLNENRRAKEKMCQVNEEIRRVNEDDTPQAKEDEITRAKEE
ncbi:AAA-domain-containing protein [Stipitochalara longipes BDJ]|nr:AAA-domain-containing protein [Stipitochalara longipes BDJ]